MKNAVMIMMFLALGLITLAAISDQPSPARAASEKNADEQNILLGPFSLADMLGKDFARQFEKGGGPAETEITKSFAECKYYILDKKRFVMKEWRFVDGYPKFLAEGSFHHVFKDAKERDFVIDVSKYQVAVSTTKSTAYRKGCNIGVALAVRGEWGVWTAMSISGRAEINYDIDGKILMPKKLSE